MKKIKLIRKGRMLLALLAFIAVFFYVFSANLAKAAPLTITRTSVFTSRTTSADVANAFSSQGTISSTGQYVAFSACSTDLVVGYPSSGNCDIFVYDHTNDIMEDVSVAPGGGTANNSSYNPRISSDGRYVAFWSFATNLVASPTVSGSGDVYLYDRQSQTTTLISISFSGLAGGNGGSGDFVDVSTNGRYVSFDSAATNLIASDTNAHTDVFVRDTQSGTTTRVSVDNLGTAGNGNSCCETMSDDGRYVAFESAATNLVAGDTNGLNDLFVYDLQNSTIERVDVSTAGAQITDGGVSGTGRPYISGDGRYVAFVSSATTLVAGDTNAKRDIFVRDRTGSTTTLVSLAFDGSQGNLDSGAVSIEGFPSISDDGRFVAFESRATNMINGGTPANTPTVYLRDTTNNTTVIIAHADTGAPGHHFTSYEAQVSGDGNFVSFTSELQDIVTNDPNGNAADVFRYNVNSPSTIGIVSGVSLTQGNDDSFAYHGAMSTTGRYSTFYSAATNLVSGDSNAKQDVFLYDNTTPTIERVSLGSSNTQGNGDSFQSSISADGRYIAFDSNSTNFPSGGSNGFKQVYVRDRNSGTTQIVSVTNGGVQGNNDSLEPAISADGRYVAFYSNAANLVAGDTNATTDVFVYDRNSSTIQRVSVDNSGIQGNGASQVPAISADGRYVAFESNATNLVAGDTNGIRDIFVFDRNSSTVRRVSVDNSGTQGNALSNYSSISSDGRYVGFESDATNLVPSDTNASRDVFVYDTTGNTIQRISVNNSGTQGNADSYAYGSHYISDDGRLVSFESLATNIVAGDTNGHSDVFVYDRATSTVQILSQTAGATQGNDESYESAISPDGTHVIFDSIATNLVSGDTNAKSDTFITTFTLPNANPDAPTSLGPSNLVDGSTGADNTPTVTFNLSDPDTANTVKFQIQIDDTSNFSSPVVDYTSALAAQGAATFTVGQGVGGGSYTTGSSGQTLPDGSYYWRVKAIDNSAAASAFATANSGSIAFVISTAGGGGGGGGGGAILPTPPNPVPPAPAPPPPAQSGQPGHTSSPQPIPSPANQLPKGSFDGVSGHDTVFGWAADPDTANQPVVVNVYFDGPAGIGHDVTGGVANLPRPDVSSKFGIPGGVGFEIPVPDAVKDGKSHTIFVYAIDNNDPIQHTLLPNSGQEFILGVRKASTPVVKPEPQPVPTPKPAPQPITPEPVKVAVMKVCTKTDQANIKRLINQAFQQAHALIIAQFKSDIDAATDAYAQQKKGLAAKEKAGLAAATKTDKAQIKEQTKIDQQAAKDAFAFARTEAIATKNQALKAAQKNRQLALDKLKQDCHVPFPIPSPKPEPVLLPPASQESPVLPQPSPTPEASAVPSPSPTPSNPEQPVTPPPSVTETPPSGESPTGANTTPPYVVGFYYDGTNGGGDVIGDVMDTAATFVTNAADATEVSYLSNVSPDVYSTARAVEKNIPGQSATLKIGSAAVLAIPAVTSTISVMDVVSLGRSAINYVWYLILLLLEAMGLRKKRKPWGVVFDSVTMQPLAFSRVQVLNEAGRVLETVIAGPDGRYGFLISPRILGGPSQQIQFIADHAGYKFPSKETLASFATYPFDDIYTGGMMSITNDQTPNFDLPLDPIDPKQRKVYMRGAIKKSLLRLSNFSFWVAFPVTLVGYMSRPTIIEYLLFFMFLVIAATRLIQLKPKPYGVVTDIKTGQPMSFASIVLNDLQGKKVTFAVTDFRGRYFLLAPKGSYEVLATTSSNILPARQTRQKVVTHAGWVSTDLRV